MFLGVFAENIVQSIFQKRGFHRMPLPKKRVLYDICKQIYQILQNAMCMIKT